MPANTAIPTPPRLTGDAATDIGLLHQWATDFYQAAVVEAKLLDPSHQATAGTFDANNLPDPTSTSIAKAQDVANRAYALAQSLVP